MNGWKRSIRVFLAALFGALGGSLPALGCTGGCGSCFSCAGMGVIAVIAAIGAAGKRKQAVQGGGELRTPEITECKTIGGEPREMREKGMVPGAASRML